MNVGDVVEFCNTDGLPRRGKVTGIVDLDGYWVEVEWTELRPVMRPVLRTFPARDLKIVSAVERLGELARDA